MTTTPINEGQAEQPEKESAEALAAAQELHPEYSQHWFDEIPDKRACWKALLDDANNQRFTKAQLIDRHFAPLREALRNAEAERDDWENRYNRERNERQKEIGMQEYRGNTISYIYDKERNYGRHFDRMRAENDALKAELAALKTPGSPSLSDVVAQLRSEISALRKDKERLDWLEDNLGKVTPGSSDAKFWILGQKEHAPNKATNIRAAIDVAIPSQPEGGR